MAVRRHKFASSSGFTLVELLVVIGIIAVLIGVLLPALSKARAQASALKCSAQMRQLGLAFQMYAMDNKGYWPPCRLAAAYNIDGFNYSTTSPAYWQNFLAKYATKLRVGTAIGNNKAQDAASARNTIFWGCPSFDGYIVGGGVTTTNVGSNAGPINTLYCGYGMNLDPHYPNAPQSGSPQYTFEGASEAADRAFDPKPWGNGSWFKAKEWTRPAERGLIADGRAYSLDARQPPQSGTLPDSVYPQHVDNMLSLWSASYSASQTTIFIYRHGSFPKAIDSETFGTGGGRISFNVLYCDGHVATCIHGSDAYRAIRMKFPG